MTKFSEQLKKLVKNFPVTIDNFIPFFLKKKNPSTPSKVIFRNHFDSTKTKEEKIKLEKRRRNQAYMALDYILSLTTYFDFFSLDAFQIASDSKSFSQLINKKMVTTDLILLPFFYTDSKILEIFQSYGMTKETVENIIAKSYHKPLKTFQEKSFDFLINFFENLLSYSPIPLVEEIVPNKKIKFSLEVYRLFEKAAINAMERFKTPVISTEILFITLMEEENTKAAKIIRKFLKDDTEWYLLRYSLIKRLYKQESFLRTQVKPNQHYFAYLLKTRFSDSEFENLIDNNYLSDAVLAFRNELITEVLQVDIYDLLKKEVYNSIQLTKKKSTRIYFPDEELEKEIENK